jgi:hypothetical protein
MVALIRKRVVMAEAPSPTEREIPPASLTLKLSNWTRAPKASVLPWKSSFLRRRAGRVLSMEWASPDRHGGW